MIHQPLVERREALAYVGIRCTADDEATLRAAVHDAFPELFHYLDEHEIEPTGPAFIRHLVLSEAGEPREFEVCAPVADSTQVRADGRLRDGVVPAGRYATVLHVGPYRHDTVPDLADARAALLEWAKRERIAWDCRQLEDGTVFRGCLESYLTGPVEETDWSTWRTEIAYLAA